MQEKADVTLSGVTMSGADIGLWMRGAKVKVRILLDTLSQCT